MKRIEDYNEYEGIDVDLEVSLFEYGLIWKLRGGEYHFVYGISTNGEEYNLFDYATQEVNTIPKEEWSFVEWDKLYSFVGYTETEFFDQPLPHIVSDLVTYYGYRNIFGSSYAPFAIDK